MSIKRQGRVFAVVVMAALGLMAMMSSAASAQWLENGATIGENKKVEVGKHSAEGILDVPSKNLEIKCTTIGGSTITLLAGTLTKSEGSVNFSGCSVWQSGTLQKNCTVAEPVSATGKSQLIVHNARTFVLFEPLVAGGNFAVVKFEGELCALPLTNNVKGTLVAECLRVSDLAKVDCLTSEITHGLQEAAGLFPLDGLKYGGGEVAANILGVATAKLASGVTWAGHL